MTPILKAPFPWFGGKSTVAAEVWERFGNVRNYVEPFAGSLAVLLGRPNPSGMETVNDKDAYISNFWRALQSAPDEVAQWADCPINENDLTARHFWLVQQKETFKSRIEGDPHFYCAKSAGWWVWGLSCWIGAHWCAGVGPWSSINGLMGKHEAGGSGVSRRLPTHGLSGVNRKMPTDGLKAYLQSISARLENCRVCSGDWTRVLGPSIARQGIAGIFLDPPYSAEADRGNVYVEEDLTIAHDVRKWCQENGSNPLLRIALCGYAGEGHEALLSIGWTEMQWKAIGGYGNQGDGRGKDNARKERIWFSPACLAVRQPELF